MLSGQGLPFLCVDLDTQEDFFALTTGAPLRLPNADLARKNIEQLTELAARLRLPVLAGCDAHAAGDPEFAAQRLPPHALAGTAGARKIRETAMRGVSIIPASGRRRPWPDLTDLALRGGGLVLEKKRFDLFSNPACREVVRMLEPRELLMWGAMLEHDVRATALTAHAHGLAVTIVSDAAAHCDPDSATATLGALGRRGVRLQFTEEVVLRLTEWEKKRVQHERRTRVLR